MPDMQTVQTKSPVAAPSIADAAYVPPAPVSAGGANAAAAIAQALSTIISQIDMSRVIAISISNLLATDLTNPAYYTESGKLEDPPLEVQAGQANFIAGSKTSGAAAGTVGIISYKIKGTNNRLVVLWSVPFSYASYENRFYFKIVDDGRNIDNDLYLSMYSDAVKATDGTFSVKDSGYKIKGVMGDGGTATLTMQIKLDNS
jgi:hypothetical protein